MAVDWSMGQPRINVGEQFQQGYQNALLMREHSQDRAVQMQQREAQMQQQRQQQQFQLTDRHRQDIRLGAGIARQYEQRSGRPMDEAGWQIVRQTAQQAGADLTGVPEHFDPQYYQGLIAAGQQLEQQAQRVQQPTTFQRDDEYIRSRYGNAAGDQYVQRHIAPPPITQHNADGTITIIQQAAPPLNQGGPQSQQPAQPVTMTPDQLRAQAEEAIRNGADPAAVQARLQQMLSGGNPTPSVDQRPPNDPAPAFHPAPGGAGPQGPRTFR